MAERYRVFGSCILLKEVFEDDLGHLFRAGTISGESFDRSIWLRVLDGPGLPSTAIIASFEEAQLIAEAIRGSQLPTHPLFLDADGMPGLGCDYVPGQPLNRVLSRARDEAFPLQPDNTLLIVEKLALALTAGESASLCRKAPDPRFSAPGSDLPEQRRRGTGHRLRCRPDPPGCSQRSGRGSRGARLSGAGGAR